MSLPLTDVRAAVDRFVGWLSRNGETSYDHQSYFAGPIGRRAKALYYRRPLLGIAAVAPMIASEYPSPFTSPALATLLPNVAPS